MKKTLGLLLVSLCLTTQASAESVRFDAQKGCEVIARRDNNSKGMDAVNAAYCLGLLDGAMGTKLYEKTMPDNLPRLCPPSHLLPTHEVAAAVAKQLKKMGNDEGTAPRGFNAIFALSLEYPCPK